MAMVMSRLSGAGQEAYADAGSTVEQVVSSIRTVSKQVAARWGFRNNKGSALGTS